MQFYCMCNFGASVGWRLVVARWFSAKPRVLWIGKFQRFSYRAMLFLGAKSTVP